MYIDGMICSVNFFLPPYTTITMRRPGTRFANLLTVFLLAGCITLAIWGAYGIQLYFQQQKQTNFLSTASTTGDSSQHQITGISAANLYDLNGSEASGGGAPFKLFDEPADPAHGQPGDPKTNPLPIGKVELFYPANKGYRIVIDLHHQYALSSLYIFDRAFEKDSVWLYTGDMHHWQAAAAYATAGTSAAWGWKHFSCARSTRFVMIRFNSYNAVISELALYGNLQQQLPDDMPLPLPALPPPTLGQFTGTNTYDYVQPDLLQPFHQVRLYQQLDYFDRDTVNAYPKNTLTLNFFKQPVTQQLRYYTDSLNAQGNRLWMSIRGLPLYLEKKGLNEKDKPVTLPGMNTEDPLSYARHARSYWNLAALFGSTKLDTNLIAVKDVPRFSGLGLMDRFENGNEEDAYWTKYYWSPVEYFAVSSADYDGHEGRMGKQHGLHNADARSKLMASGLIQLDTSRISTRCIFYAASCGPTKNLYGREAYNTTIIATLRTATCNRPAGASARKKTGCVKNWPVCGLSMTGFCLEYP